MRVRASSSSFLFLSYPIEWRQDRVPEGLCIGVLLFALFLDSIGELIVDILQIRFFFHFFCNHGLKLLQFVLQLIDGQRELMNGGGKSVELVLLLFFLEDGEDELDKIKFLEGDEIRDAKALSKKLREFHIELTTNFIHFAAQLLQL